MTTHATPAVPTIPLLINGEFVESRTTQWRDVVNPATQQVLARVPLATPEELGALTVFLCSDAAINVRGQAWAMDGGWTAV